MKKSLLATVDESEENELRQSFVAAYFLRQKLVQKLSSDISTSQRGCMNSDFSTANWAYEQAYELGYQKALSEVISILNEKS